MGGSDDLQMTPNFFWELFITFLHEIKSPYLKLKKSGKVKHPEHTATPLKLPLQKKKRRKINIAFENIIRTAKEYDEPVTTEKEVEQAINELKR